MARPEHGFQTTAVQFLERAIPGAAIWSVDNNVEGDGRDDSVRMAKIKRRERGIKSGQPDIDVLTLQPAPLGVVYIGFECKSLTGGYLSENQLARRDEIIRNGGHWFYVRTLEQIEACLRSIPIEPKASTGIIVPVPVVGARREATHRRLNEQLPF